MKAIVHREYGPPDLLGYEEVEKPTPGNGEVLVEVRAASVNPIDRPSTTGTPYPIRIGLGLRKPAAAGPASPTKEAR